MRVVWVTDVHLNFCDVERMKTFATAIMRERPARVLITGDTGEAEDVAKFFDVLAAIAPCHGVLGNHDYYGSSIAAVRERVRPLGWWLPTAPVRLTDATTLIGVDGWGDGRCGNLASTVRLADWQQIKELDGLLWCEPERRCATLQALGDAEASALRAQLATIDPGACRELLVLTHVPPFPEACWYDGKQSSPEWLPWFTCVAVGEELRRYAAAHPDVQLTVLCGHTHGSGEFRAADNLLVRTGGWKPGAKSYGNPIVQDAWTVA